MVLPACGAAFHFGENIRVNWAPRAQTAAVECRAADTRYARAMRLVIRWSSHMARDMLPRESWTAVSARRDAAIFCTRRRIASGSVASRAGRIDAPVAAVYALGVSWG